MAGLPLLNLFDDYQPISPFFNDDLGFGLGLYPHHIQRPRRIDQTALVRMPMGLLSHLGERHPSRTGKKEHLSCVGKAGFQVCMDVAQFKPSELTVKVINNYIFVEGKHEEREDEHGYISRNFVRRYGLPKEYDADKIISTLSSDGVLTVSIPKPKMQQKSEERIIQIQQTGPAHLNIKDNLQDKKEEQGESNESQEEKAKD